MKNIITLEGSFSFLINITGYNHLKRRRNDPYVCRTSNYTQSYPLRMCLIPMTLSMVHEHWASTMRLLRMLYPLILRVLGALEFFTAYPWVSSTYTDLFAASVLPMQNICLHRALPMICDPSHPSFWPSFLLLPFILPFKGRQHLLLTGLFYFVLLCKNISL